MTRVLPCEQDVLDHLLAVRPAAMSVADIRERFGHDACPSGALYNALSSNTKVEVTHQGEFFYKVSSALCSPQCRPAAEQAHA